MSYPVAAGMEVTAVQERLMDEVPPAAAAKPVGVAEGSDPTEEIGAYTERWSVMVVTVTVATIAANSAAVSIVVLSVMIVPAEFLYVTVVDSGIQFCKLSSQYAVCIASASAKVLMEESVAEAVAFRSARVNVCSMVMSLLSVVMGV